MMPICRTFVYSWQVVHWLHGTDVVLNLDITISLSQNFDIVAHFSIMSFLISILRAPLTDLTGAVVTADWNFLHRIHPRSRRTIENPNFYGQSPLASPSFIGFQPPRM